MARLPRAARSVAPLVVLLAWACACSKPEATESAPPAPPGPAAAAAAESDNSESAPGEAQAETIFKTRCSTCHGMEGKGNGAAALTLNPKPRNYTDVAWQKSVTDDHIREIIVKGGAAVGKSPLMPPNPDLTDKPAVVNALVKKVRSFASLGVDGGK
jgi:mono/diheme cytochrome c family protein